MTMPKGSDRCARPRHNIRGISLRAEDLKDALALKLVSMLTCPVCGHHASETMPTDSCQYFYECSKCRTLLKPKAGDCCVFCSYGNMPCPPIQEARAGGLHPSCCS
jgi:hypothetical protein